MCRSVAETEIERKPPSQFLYQPPALTRRHIGAAWVAVGWDEGALPLLYAAVLDGKIRRVMLDGMLVSYESVVSSRLHRRILQGVSPGMLKYYDLQDLVAALAPRNVWIVNGTDRLGHELPASEVTKEYGRALESFNQQGATQAIHIKDRKPGQDTAAFYREFTAAVK
jgi:hypothetical protein